MDGTKIFRGGLGHIFGVIVLAFVLIPILALVFVSLSSANFLSFPWDEGWGVQSYKQIPQQSRFITGAVNSLQLAAYTAVISVCIGLLGAVAQVRHRFPGRRLLILLGSSSLFVPQVMLGLALLVTLSALGVPVATIGLRMGHIAIALPFALRILAASLTGINPDQELAAQNLGASKLRAFWSVTLPQIRTGVTAAFIMCFIISFDNVAVSLFLAGPGFSVLPVALYNYAANVFDGVAAAVSVSMVAIAMTVIVAIERTVGLDKLFGGDAQ